MTQVVDEPLEAGREAARRHAWRDAYDLLRKADEAGALAADDLASLGDAAWWTGRLEEAIGLRERAYAAFVEAAEPRRAAMVTVPLAMDYGLRGALSVSTGWIARGERLLADEPEGFEHGHLALMRGTTSIDLGELEQAGESFRRARELGARFGDRGLETTALVFQGRSRSGPATSRKAWPSWTRRPPPPRAASSTRSPRGSSTASPSTPATRSATAAGPQSGRALPTTGANAST